VEGERKAVYDRQDHGSHSLEIECFRGIFVLLLILVTTIADVFADKVLGTPFPGATELVMSVMPISVCAFLLSVQIQKRHISHRYPGQPAHSQVAGLLQLLTQPFGAFSLRSSDMA
jgi:hypothetical protein